MVSTIKMSSNTSIHEFIKSMTLMNQDYGIEIEGFNDIIITTDDRNQRVVIKSSEIKRRSRTPKNTTNPIGFRKDNNE